MPDLADLYPGYASHWIDTSAGRMFVRTGGEGPPLLLIHGYAQTNVMWHKVAPALAKHFSLVIPDLPGYGWSAVPKSGEGHAPYDKRSMAKIMVEIMEQLGHVRFRLAGHDRGGRVAYRLALDHPGRVERICVLDIIPTAEMWHRMD
ncbi:MAG: alpha/beta fold hydrolase, partial [Pseudorhodoplanes sp.]|nr:alpha/beta fold hydrolase [Pseudorhodoplanes sp.]